MTLFLVKNELGEMIDSFLLPVILNVQELLEVKYRDFSWFTELVKNVNRFEEFKLTPEYKNNSRMVSEWVPSTPYNMKKIKDSNVSRSKVVIQQKLKSDN